MINPESSPLFLCRREVVAFSSHVGARERFLEQLQSKGIKKDRCQVGSAVSHIQINDTPAISVANSWQVWTPACTAAWYLKLQGPGATSGDNEQVTSGDTSRTETITRTSRTCMQEQCRFNHLWIWLTMSLATLSTLQSASVRWSNTIDLFLVS